jgi:hypothetical protein
MHIVEFSPGTHIARAAAELVDAAKKHGSAEGMFNDIHLLAEAETTPEAVVDFFTRATEARDDAYRKSPEGQKAEREADERRQAAQARHDALMQRLPKLDLYDQVAVLDWLCEMQDPSDHVDVIVRRKTIVETFERAGYEAGENCGEDFRPDDRKNVFRYLVGQALSGLKDGPAIHPILHKFTAEWKAKFIGTHAA